MFPMDSLPPLRFKPILKPALWGGQRLRSIYDAPAGPDPIGEAWLLSDCPDQPSVVADGVLAGRTLRELMEQIPERLLGDTKPINGRFPLLVKLLHARAPLSVQVHPDDTKARELEGVAAVGKTEAWVVLEADPTACVYAGLLPAATPDGLRKAIHAGTVEELLYCMTPAAGDCFFLKAGTVHAIGGGLVLFEVQQTCDLTYRLFDWGRTDPKTGRPRDLHLEKGLACVDYDIGPCRPARPTEEGHGRARRAALADCEYFALGRWEVSRPFATGSVGECRILAGAGGRAVIRHRMTDYPIGLGDVWLLTAETGPVEVIPDGRATILECAIPN